MLIDKKGRIFGKISIVDIIIVLLLIVIVVFGIRFFKTNDKSASATKIQYTVQINKVKEDVYNAIQDNTAVYDSVKNTPLGTVVSHSKKPYEITSVDSINGKYIKNTLPGLYNVLITIEADSYITDSSIKVGKNIIRVNGRLDINTKDILGTTYVVGLKILEDEHEEAK